MKTNVTFDSAGVTLAGHLHLPDDLTSSGGGAAPRPAVVVGHPAAGVKEQAAGLYAAHLAEQGFVALAFDSAYQGESGGLPRGLEDPAHRVEDLKAAVSFLSVHERVDPERIGALGICASGGYVVPAAAGDHRIKAVATVSAADISRQFRQGPDDRQDPAVVQGLLAAAAAARTAEARGGQPQVFPLFPASEEEARAGGQHVFEGWEYYRTDRARHSRAAEAFTLNSVDRIVPFEPFRSIGLIAPRPLLMVVGTEAVTRHMTTEAFANAGAPKDLAWIDGATHVGLYDRPDHVSAAVDRISAFFRTHLAAAAVAPIGEKQPLAG
jgi:fermentation-respiration switch protein FrsA (DUF1100 family)